MKTDLRDGIAIWFCDTDAIELSDDDAEALLAPSEQQRASRFAFPHLRRRYRLGHALLRKILAQELGCGPMRITIDVREGGKPFVAEGPEFNMSASGQWLAICLGKEIDLGIDVEILRELDDMAELSRRCFSQQECRELEAQPEALKLRAFFRGWTRKEAVSKALGYGLAMDFRSFSIPLDGVEACTPVVRSSGFPGNEEWFVHPLRFESEIESAIAASKPIETVDVYHVGRDLSWTTEARRQ